MHKILNRTQLSLPYAHMGLIVPSSYTAEQMIMTSPWKLFLALQYKSVWNFRWGKPNGISPECLIHFCTTQSSLLPSLRVILQTWRLLRLFLFLLNQICQRREVISVWFPVFLWLHSDSFPYLPSGLNNRTLHNWSPSSPFLHGLAWNWTPIPAVR